MKSKKNKVNERNKVEKKEIIKLAFDNLWNWAIAIGILYFILLLTTAPRLNVGYADSDELLTVAYNTGVAHPSGYPLYILILSWFLKLPIGSIAFRGHLFSIICHSLSLSFMFVFLWRLVNFWDKKLKTKILNSKIDKYLVALIGVIVLGGNYLFWLYGQITEKFSFGNLLIAIMFWLLMKIWESKKNVFKDWLILGGLIGIMIGHHQNLVVFLPMILLMFYFKLTKQNKKINQDVLKKYSIYFGAGVIGALIISSALLWFLNNQNSQFSWKFEKSLTGLLNHVIRKDFAVLNANGEIGSAYFNVSGEEMSQQIAKGTPAFIKYSAKYFGIVNLVMLILGILFLRKIDRKLFYIFGSGLIISMLFSAYVTIDNFNTIPSVIRQYLPSYMIMSIFIALGWFAFFQKLIQIIEVLGGKKYLSYLLVGFCLLILFFRFVKIYPQANLSKYDFVAKFHQQILNQLPENAFLACFSDVSCFALLYEQNINKLREDVIILPTAYPLVKEKLDKISGIKNFDYENKQMRFFDYVSASLGKRRVFVLDFNREYGQVLGTNYDFVYFIPNGYVTELTREVPEELPEFDYSFSSQVKKNPAPELDVMRKWINTIIPRIHFNNSQVLLKMGKRVETRDELNMAMDILISIPEIDIKQAEGQRTAIENGQSQDNYMPGFKATEAEAIWEEAQKFFENENYRLAYDGVLGVLSYEPLNKEARIMLAQILTKNRNWNNAIVEYKNIIKYHPDEEIESEITKLEQQLQYEY